MRKYCVSCEATQMQMQPSAIILFNLLGKQMFWKIVIQMLSKGGEST